MEKTRVIENQRDMQNEKKREGQGKRDRRNIKIQIVSQLERKKEEKMKREIEREREHREFIFRLGYNSGHIANPFFPLFYPHGHRLKFPAPFHLMLPTINNQQILDPLWQFYGT